MSSSGRSAGLKRGVVLYGPPAVGKDTITRYLGVLDQRYVLFPCLEAGPGLTNGPRRATPTEIEELRRRGEIVWESRRHGAAHVIDRPGLAARLAEHVPVVHLRHVEGIDAVTGAFPDARWLVAFLWCPREIAEARVGQRGTGDTEGWDEVPIIGHADLTINTLLTDPEDAARQIDSRVTAMGQPWSGPPVP
ncbi:kinase [Micromonospora sp. NPDC047812]|uniref:kinase n=1 Tax=Micromonospora sp. NPDC047812 TaxID=3155742 RepID=UPI0034558D84